MYSGADVAQSQRGCAASVMTLGRPTLRRVGRLRGRVVHLRRRGRVLRQLGGGRLLRQLGGGRLLRQLGGGRLVWQLSGGRFVPAEPGDLGVARAELGGQPVQQQIGLGEPVAAQGDRQPHAVDVVGHQRAFRRKFPGRLVPQRRRDLLAGRQEPGGQQKETTGQQDRQQPVQEQVQHRMIVPCPAAG